jgi:hypothetical protein
VIWNIQAAGDWRLMDEFNMNLWNMESTEEFVDWWNRKSGGRGAQPPFTAWNSDTANYDMDKTEGGWGTSATGALHRQNLKSLQSATEFLAKDLVKERVLSKSDGPVIARLKVAIAAKAGDPAARPRDSDFDLYDRTAETIKDAAGSGLGLSSTAMIFQIMGSVRGVFGHASDKGTPADHVVPQAEFDATVDSYDYAVNYRRQWSALTSTSLDDINSSPWEVAKDQVRSMTDDGREVYSEEFTVEKLVEMYDDPEKRQFARSILFPHVMDRTEDGKTKTVLATGKSLKKLIKGGHFKSLFGQTNSLSVKKALRYIMFSEVEARKFGGHLEWHRAISTAVIAQLSGQNHQLNEEEMLKLVLSTTVMLVETVQQAGAIASRIPEHPDDNKLGDLAKIARLRQRAEARQSLRRVSKISKEVAARFARDRRMGTVSSDAVLQQLLAQPEQMMTEAILTTSLANYALIVEQQRRALAQSMTPQMTSTERQRIVAQMRFAREDFKEYSERVGLLMADDILFQLETQWAYDPDQTPVWRKARETELAKWVESNEVVIQQGEDVRDIVMRLNAQLIDGVPHSEIRLKPEEWRALSMQAVTHKLRQALITPGLGGGPAYPDGSKEGDRKYWDPSFYYVAEPVISPTSPLVLAAAQIHLRGKGYGDDMSIDENMLLDTLKRGLLRPKRYGQWTDDIPIAVIEAHEQLDKAAAGTSMKQSGILPKTERMAAAAMKRTFRVPTLAEETALLSTTFLSIEDLNLPNYEPVEIFFPGATVAEKRPKIQLINRFAKSVTLLYRDPADPSNTITVDLIRDPVAKDPNMARPWPMNDKVRDSGYFEIHPDRLLDSVQNAVTLIPGLTADQVVGVEVKFLHPDSQPIASLDETNANKSWYNNILFEGTSFTTDADTAPSLPQTLFFYFNALNPREGTHNITATKKGRKVRNPVKLTTSEERAANEENWHIDFAEMLRAKTKVMMQTQLGDQGLLDPEYYNAVYKEAKYRHWVRGMDPDTKKTVLWSSEQVIDWQRTHPPTLGASGKLEAVPLPFVGFDGGNPTLWLPSDPVLLSFLGRAPHRPGELHMIDDVLNIDLSMVRPFVGVTTDMLEPFDAGIRAEPLLLEDTEVTARSRQGVVQFDELLTRKQKDAWDARIRYIDSMKVDVHTARSKVLNWDPKQTMVDALRISKDGKITEAVPFFMSHNGMTVVPKGNETDSEEAHQMVQEVAASMMASSGGFAAGWLLQENGLHEPTGGRLSGVSMDNRAKLPLDQHLAPGDLVIVDLGGFTEDVDNNAKARLRINQVAAAHPYIKLTTLNGRKETMAASLEILDQLGYEKMGDSDLVFAPPHLSSQYQNMNAKISQLTAINEALSPRGRVLTFFTRNQMIGDQAAWVKPNNKRLNAVKVERNMVPTGYLAGMNRPAGAQIPVVYRQLQGLRDDDVDFQKLLDEHNGHIKNKKTRRTEDDKFIAAFDVMLRDLKKNRPYPKEGDMFGTGSLVPLVEPARGAATRDRILLYRHGYKPIDRDELENQLDPDGKDVTNGRMVAVFSGKRNPKQRAHVGEVVEFQPHGQYGLSVVLHIDLAYFADKMQLENEALKIVTSPIPASIMFPRDDNGEEYDVIPGWQFALWVQWKDANDKQAVGDVILDHASAMAFLGWNLLPYAQEAFGNISEEQARQILNGVANKMNDLDIAEADRLMHSQRLDLIFQQQLLPVTQTIAPGREANWVGEVAAPATVAQQITRAALIYLATRGARLEDILKSGSFAAKGSIDLKSHRPPTLFTQWFDLQPFNSALRLHMNEKFNQLFIGDAAKGIGYAMQQDFQVVMFNGQQVEVNRTPLPEDPFTEIGLTVTTHTSTVHFGTKPRAARVVEVRDGKDVVGYLTYSPRTGQILTVHANPSWKDKGLVSGMYSYARMKAKTEGKTMPEYSPALMTAADTWKMSTLNGVYSGSLFEEQLGRAPVSPGNLAMLETRQGYPDIAERKPGEWGTAIAGWDEKKTNQVLRSIDSVLRVDEPVGKYGTPLAGPFATPEQIEQEIERWQSTAKRIGEIDGTTRKLAEMYDPLDPRYGRGSTYAGISPLANELMRTSQNATHGARTKAGGTVGVPGMAALGPKPYMSGKAAEAVQLVADYLMPLMPTVDRTKLEEYILAAGQFVDGMGSSHAVGARDPNGGVNRKEFDILRALVDGSPKVDMALYRGGIGGTNGSAGPRFDADGFLISSTNDLSSWTSDIDVAELFGSNHILKVNGAQALNVGAIGVMDEYLTYGKYKLITSYKNPSRKGGMIYELEQIRDTDPRPALRQIGSPDKNVIGYMGFPEWQSSGDNPVTSGQVAHVDPKQDVSLHSMWSAFQMAGARTPYPVKLKKVRDFVEGTGVRWADSPTEGTWSVYDVPPDALSVWNFNPPGVVDNWRVGREWMASVRMKIKRRKDRGWDPNGSKSDSVKEYDRLASQSIRMLGLNAAQKVIIDYWVRQILAKPGRLRDQEGDVGWVDVDDALKAVQEIHLLISKGYLPTMTGMQPIMHLDDLQLIFEAQKNRAVDQRWSPKTMMDDSNTKADTWDEWVEVALGTAFLSDLTFNRALLAMADGFFHTYQGSQIAMLRNPISLDRDKVKNLLLDEDGRERASIDPGTHLLAYNPIILDTSQITLEDLTTGKLTAIGRTPNALPADSIIAERMADFRKWHQETGQPMPVTGSMKDFGKNGRQLIHYQHEIQAFYKFWYNIRLGLAMINPLLWVSAFPEQGVRGVLDRAVSNLEGRGTVGFTAKTQARTTAMLNKERTGAIGSAVAKPLNAVGRVAAKFGFEHAFTPEQISKLNEFYKVLGSDKAFTAMISGDLFYLRPQAETGGWFVRKSEKFAKAGTWFQDPTRGTRNPTLARRYLEAALNEMNRMPTAHIVDIDTLVAQMDADHDFLKKNFPTAHHAGLMRIADVRAIKATMWSLAAKGIIEPMAHGNAGWQFLGNMVFRIPLAFQTFFFNLATTLTGMQGPSALLAAQIHGRNKGIIGHIQAAIEGAPYDAKKHGQFNLEDALEGIDISREFTRSGVTITGWFMLGMMAQGLGMTGEDDEERRRRQMSKYRGIPFEYNPLEIQNDFLESDSVFLGNLPFGLGAMFGGENAEMMQVNWIMKQYVSPIVGMERFFDTGDFRQVMWGFEDAIGSMPLVNTIGWSDAAHTAAELAGLADKEAAKGNPDGDVKGFGFLVTAVGTMERMLLESSFINSIYVGVDPTDKDPYSLPLRDSNGDIQYDIEHLARAQNISTIQYLQENRDKLTREIEGGAWVGKLYIDPKTSEVKETYLHRRPTAAAWHGFTESRFTLALGSALFDGLTHGSGPWGSDYWRYNMPPKMQDVAKPTLPRDEIEALILADYVHAGQTVPRLTQEEIASIYKKKVTDLGPGHYYDSDKIDQAASEAYANIPPEPLSMQIDGKEYMTRAGARGVFEGLMHGSVTLDSPALAGVWIPWPMRNAIVHEWTKEIMQEGHDLGMSHTAAYYRMRRIMEGPTDGSNAPGLKDIIFSDKLSYDPKYHFQQLNTTYMMGPNGRPWATSYQRAGSVENWFGLKPFTSATGQQSDLTPLDERRNTTVSVGPFGSINTGMRGLYLTDESRYVPTAKEMNDAVIDAIEKAGQAHYSPASPGTKKSGYYSPYHYTRHGYSGYGSGGGGGYGYANFEKMYNLPHGRAPQAHNIPYVSMSTPSPRRSTVHRERVWSERGRLKQWQ